MTLRDEAHTKLALSGLVLLAVVALVGMIAKSDLAPQTTTGLIALTSLIAGGLITYIARTKPPSE